jgi:uncharacterized damage-inducible protein DinB
MVTAVRELYAVDRWANRRLLDVVAGLEPELAIRPVGTQFSAPTLKGVLAHVLGAEGLWLERWKGTDPTAVLTDADFPDVAALRARWEPVEREVRAFVDALEERDLQRVVRYRNLRGDAFALPLWVLLQHVANHSTHHRSEVATMLTMLHASPPPTDLLIYHLMASGQMTAS